MGRPRRVRPGPGVGEVKGLRGGPRLHRRTNTSTWRQPRRAPGVVVARWLTPFLRRAPPSFRDGDRDRCLPPEERGLDGRVEAAGPRPGMGRRPPRPRRPRPRLQGRRRMTAGADPPTSPGQISRDCVGRVVARSAGRLQRRAARTTSAVAAAASAAAAETRTARSHSGGSGGAATPRSGSRVTDLLPCSRAGFITSATCSACRPVFASLTCVLQEKPSAPSKGGAHAPLNQRQRPSHPQPWARIGCGHALDEVPDADCCPSAAILVRLGWGIALLIFPDVVLRHCPATVPDRAGSR